MSMIRRKTRRAGRKRAGWGQTFSHIWLRAYNGSWQLEDVFISAFGIAWSGVAPTPTPAPAP